MIRPILFRIEPEHAHNLTRRLLGLPIAPILSARFDLSDLRLPVTAFGLTFRNPASLAAGYDKNGIALRSLAALGFGHVEAGTVTGPRSRAALSWASCTSPTIAPSSIA